MAAPADVLKMIKDKEVKFVDLRFTDTRGKEQHVHGPGEAVHAGQVRQRPRVRRLVDRRLEGHRGLRHAADARSGHARDIDPFIDETTLNITCDVVEPSDGKGYERDPRSLAKRAEAYLKSTGLGDTAYFGPEPEFFIFDSVEWSVDMSGCYCKIVLERSAVVDGREVRRRQHGPSPAGQGRLFPGAAGRFAAGHPLGDVPGARAAWASRSKCITTKWRPRASARSAPSSTRW